MRIRQLSLIRYGKFTDKLLELPKSERDIHLIVGPNEAGKSTTRSAIGDLLFGIPARTPLSFRHDKPLLRLGAVLEHGGESFAFERNKANQKTLRSLADAALPEQALDPWLGGASRSFFEQMYALDHAALVAGGAGILQASDDLGRMLFQSAAGLDQLGKVLKALEEEAGGQWSRIRSKQRAYYQALDAFDTAATQLRNVTARTKDWKEQLDAVRAAEQALGEVLARQREVRLRRSQLERIRRVQPSLAALDDCQAQRLALGDAVLLPEDAAAVLARSETERAVAGTDIERHAAALREAEEALAALSPDAPVLALAADIRALDEDRLQARAHAERILAAGLEIESLWRGIQAGAAALGWPDEAEDPLRARLPTAAGRARLERLIQQQGSVEQGRAASRRSLLAKQQELAQALARLESLPPLALSPALQIALDRARKLGDHDGALQALADQQARLETQRQHALASLAGWTAEPAALRGMLVPDPAGLQALLAGQRQGAAGLQACEQALADRRAQHDKAQRELDQLISTWQPVSREQVLAARQQRDASWLQIKAAPAQLALLAPALEQQVAQADQLADIRLDKLQHEASRVERVQSLELLALGIAHDEARGAALRAQLAAGQEAWLAQAAACGLAGLPLSMAESWLALRQRALDADAAADEGRRLLAARQLLGEAARQGLLRELGADPGLGLEHAIKQAEAEVAQGARSQGERTSLEAQIANARLALLALEEADAETGRQGQAWQADWQAALAAAGFAGQPGMPELRAALERMAGMQAALDQIRRLRVERIQAMQAELDALAGAAESLARRVAPDLAEAAPADIVRGLLARLDAATAADSEARRLGGSRLRAQEGWAAARARLQELAARLAPLHAAVGSEDQARLAAAIERSGRRRQLEREHAALAQKLAIDGDGLLLETLRTEGQGLAAQALVRELDELAQQDDTLMAQSSRLGAEQQRAQALLDGFDGSDKAASADAQRQDAIARMAQAVDGYIKAHTASRLLKWSIEQYRQTRQGPMLALASGIFAALTLGSFTRLMVDFDADSPRLRGLRPDGEAVGVAGMSEGTRDQLYLALRLAAMDMHVSEARPLPFIADDLFINFDDRRAAAGLQALGDLSRKTQVIFLTHHEHLVDVARDVLGPELNVLDLKI